MSKTGLFKRFTKFLPQKKIVITEVEYEKERERRRRIAEAAAWGDDIKADEADDGMVNGDYEVLEREIAPERIVCPNCNAVTWEGLDYCDKCGKEL